MILKYWDTTPPGFGGTDGNGEPIWINTVVYKQMKVRWWNLAKAIYVCLFYDRHEVIEEAE